jgi:hypothetical protein
MVELNLRGRGCNDVNWTEVNTTQFRAFLDTVMDILGFHNSSDNHNVRKKTLMMELV